jgi:APA family basic amino acid/polyamine antiporter
MLIFLILAYGAIRLRNREPDLPRPYKMPFYPWPALLTIAANGALLVLFVVSDWRTGIYSLLSLALAWPLYVLGRSRWRGMRAS